MNDIATLARRLTKNQKEAIVRDVHQRGAAVIVERFAHYGLAQAQFDGMMRRLYLANLNVVEPYVHGGWELLPLGQELREHLIADKGYRP